VSILFATAYKETSMNKLLVVLLVLVVGLPSMASAAQPSGTLVGVPDSEPGGQGGPATKSWLFSNIFVVRAHICRVTGTLLCGPDPLVPGGAPFGGVIRIWVPFTDTYTIYAFVSDAEGNVMTFRTAAPSIIAPPPQGAYFNFTPTFPPLPDDLYKFHVLVVASGSGLITFSDFYQFRIGGPNSTGCCP
jgi:hypothetical protein